MILVIGGTSDGRAIARELKESGAGVLVSAATGYGSAVAAGDGVSVTQGRLNLEDLAELIITTPIRVVVDASHPFAAEVSLNAAGACERAGIPYIRYARPGVRIPDSPLVEMAEGYRDAARKACRQGSAVFLATGSKSAGIFIEEARKKGGRVIIRAIPDPEVIKGIIEMGVSPADVAAMQGPFSEEMNIALLRHYRADVVVTKESGREGGLEEKISAALKMGLPVIVIKRPPEPPDAVCSVEEAVEKALKTLNNISTLSR